MRSLGADIVGVSPDTQAESRELQERLGLSFIILSDLGLVVTDSFGLRHPGGRASTGEDKPFPTTFVLDARGVVRAKFENESHRVRPEPEKVLEALRAVAPPSS